MAVDKGSVKGRVILFFKKTGGAVHRSMYRWSGGRMGGDVRGVPVLLLTTTGRKSGEKRTVPLVYDTRNGSYLVASSNAGHWEPAWLLNLRDDPNVIVEVGSNRFEATAEIFDGERGRELWAEYELLHPSYPAYRESRGTDFPMVILTPD
ncbi:MAG TPA: nitroreductase/quinone reductase family protein [Acidimicrobiia bacterium]|jgi:deazaflavin-dependent oxidoreductase (nitroreductase family)